MQAFSVTCATPFLVAGFAEPQSMLSWSLTRPGFVSATHVAWLEVTDQDLPLGVDPAELLQTRMEARGLGDAVHLMTSRYVRCFETAQAISGDVTAACLATTGLSNAGRVGESLCSPRHIGTINLLAHVDRPLSPAALIEAMSIAAQARTAAVIDLDLRRDGKTVTGTGTDCIVVAAPQSGNQEHYAGLHTNVGAAIGRAVYDAVLRGGEAWISEQLHNSTLTRGASPASMRLPAEPA